MVSTEAALTAVRNRALAARVTAESRWSAAIAGEARQSLEELVEGFQSSGRLTLNFHPDRVTRDGRTVAAGLLADGRYRSQWQTGLSAGSRSAVPGGQRQAWERALFDGAYDTADPSTADHPLYGSLDLLLDPHGGSPRFGSSFVVLRSTVRIRTTLCVGDSVTAPRDVGTADAPWSILAGLAEQASQGALLNRGLGVKELLGALDSSYVSPAPSRQLDGYVEAQVHGGVSLRDDVAAIIVDPSFAGTQVERDLAAASQEYRFELVWHGGSELEADKVPPVRAPTIPELAKTVARPDGIVDARSIGAAAALVAFEEPTPAGDDPESPLQQLKYLWHTVLAYGHDAVRGRPS